MRIDDASLRRMRAGRTSRILVTGGTGFLGSHIAAALLGAGYRVAVLARSTKALPARARIERLADWHGLDEEARRRLAIVEGDVLETGWAAAAAEAGADEIVHCASSTAFVERKRAEIEAANIGGLRNVLDFAARGGCAFFHHVSTAYVAGRRTGPCPEDWVETAAFTNVYEETKARGEVLARDLCRREGLRLNVYRPTIVTGDSRTGRTLRFNALYFPVKAVVYLRDIYLADIRERGGRRASELGIRTAEEGRIIMPLRIEIGGGGINLVPVDHCVAAFMAVFEDGIDGGIYHIASPAPTRIEDIIAYAKRFFRLEGIEACGSEAFAGRPRNALETLFDSYLETYRPYMQEARTFENANAAPMLARRGLVCPAFDYDVFALCMAYALDVDWGSKLFAR
ncbi:MAG: SDR family oxidoreductase [Candidatus Aminicenantes bacterium]|nr:SDR family oxidoreductase [Candidatus Aminicenantes bacterium]